MGKQPKSPAQIAAAQERDKRRRLKRRENILKKRKRDMEKFGFVRPDRESGAI